VPGDEPVEMLEKTLQAMKDVEYDHDNWVLDEGNDSSVKKSVKDWEYLILLKRCHFIQ
jgi:hypothetical protein